MGRGDRGGAPGARRPHRGRYAAAGSRATRGICRARRRGERASSGQASRGMRDGAAACARHRSDERQRLARARAHAPCARRQDRSGRSDAQGRLTRTRLRDVSARSRHHAAQRPPLRRGARCLAPRGGAQSRGCDGPQLRGRHLVGAQPAGRGDRSVPPHARPQAGLLRSLGEPGARATGAAQPRRRRRQLSARARHPARLSGSPREQRDARFAARRLSQRLHGIRVALAAQDHDAPRLQEAGVAGRTAQRQDHPALRRAGLRRHLAMPAVRAGGGRARRPAAARSAAAADATRNHPACRWPDRACRPRLARVRRPLPPS